MTSVTTDKSEAPPLKVVGFLVDRRGRGLIHAAQAAELAGIAYRTFTAYCSTGDAPAPAGVDEEGRKVWYPEQIRQWRRDMPRAGRGFTP